MRPDHEDMRGVDSFPLGDDPVENIEILENGRLPFVAKPGPFLPKDAFRDRQILEALKLAGWSAKPGGKLDYEQSKRLYETVRFYFESTDPLMRTERWLAEFVEKNRLEYTDHDGKKYVMKGGVRRRTG